MIQKKSYSLSTASTRVDKHFDDMVKIHGILYNVLIFLPYIKHYPKRP